jgi:glutamate-1-semialdehyde 2,1-aminomutase
MGNGFPIAALAGKRELMELGGYDHDRERVFLLSQTYGGMRLSLAAFLATVDVMEAEDVHAHLQCTGVSLRDRINATAEELGILDHFAVVGDPAGLLYITKDARGERSQEFRTLFLQETISRGVLAPNLFVSAAMGPVEVDRTVEAVGQALVVYRKALEDGVEGLLHGRPVRPALRSRT